MVESAGPGKQQRWDVTSRVVDFVHGLSYDSLPATVLAQTKRRIVDSTSVMWAGSATEFGQQVAVFIEELGERGDVTVPGTSLKSSARYAALFGATVEGINNGMAGYRSVETIQLHPEQVVMPVAFALAEENHLHGRDLITAVAAGVEIAIRIGLGVQPSHGYKGFHISPTAGALAGSVTAAKLLGLDRDGILSALGGATILLPLTVMDLAPGKTGHGERFPRGKALHSGRAAETAIFSAMAAQRGMLGGQLYPLEGPRGFCHATSDAPNFDAMVDGLGQRYLSEHAYYKRYVPNRWFHGCIDLILQLLGEHHIDPQKVQRVGVSTVEYVSDKTMEITDDSDAEECFTASFPFTVAFTFLYPDEIFSPLLYTDHARSRMLDVREFARRVEIIHEPEFTAAYPGKIPTEIEVVMEGGQKYVARSDYMRGDEPELPWSEEELEDKYYRWSTTRVSRERASEIKGLWAGLEDIEDAAEVIALLGTG